MNLDIVPVCNRPQGHKDNGAVEWLTEKGNKDIVCAWENASFESERWDVDFSRFPRLAWCQSGAKLKTLVREIRKTFFIFLL